MTAISRIPKRRYYGQAMQSMMSSIRLQWNRKEEELRQAGYSGKSVLGYKIPYWQRSDDKWSEAQQVAFIESVFLGVSLGTFMVNSTLNNPDLDQILLDGLQRLTAIQQYWQGEFGVPGEDGKVYLWTDLTSEERAHFDRMVFPWVESEYESEEEAIAAYNHHNFGGTPHTEADRAVPGNRSIK